MNSKEIRDHAPLDPQIPENSFQSIQIFAVTILFCFLLYLAYFINCSFKTIIPSASNFQLFAKPEILASDEIFSEIRPKRNFALTFLCLIFALIPLYANMLFALVNFKSHIKENIENNTTCSLKCSLPKNTKDSIRRAISFFRKNNSSKNLHLFTESVPHNNAKTQIKKSDICRDESLESLSTYCETPLIGVVKSRTLPINSQVTPFMISEPYIQNNVFFIVM